jgi:hypothetical protein
VIVWSGVDSHGPASIYIASESRMSFGRASWDELRKTYWAARSPDIFAYAGSVLFPSLALSQFVDALDAGLIDASWSAERKARLLLGFLRSRHESFPERQPFVVVHCCRIGNGTSARFVTTSIRCDGHEFHLKTHRESSKSSELVFTDGTGDLHVAEHMERWRNSASAGTSRTVFASFVAAIQAGGDPHSGGAPQLVGLYRRGFGKAFGTVVGRRRYFLGVPIDVRRMPADIEWRNELFERVDGKSARRQRDAQRHERLPGP